MITKTRKTKETDITISLALRADTPEADVDSGVGFFDHMLNAFALHGGLYLKIRCDGDLHIDCHHTIEDIGLVLGDAFAEALGDKAGIARFGEASVPMDEALASVCLDLSNRPYLVYDAPDMAPMIGSYDTEMTQEFLRAFAQRAGITLHARVLYGKNAHHMTEALYKALGRALRAACVKTGGTNSTKGVL